MTAYLDGPADAPTTIVLVHGLSVTADLWRLHTPRLADQGMRIVRYDQRAHGRSTRGTAPITLDKLADDLAHIIELLAPHGPLVLAGHSMGGMILQTLTTKRPDLLPRVHGLLLISTPDGPVTTRPQLGLRTRLLGWGRDLLAATCTRTPAAVDAMRRRLPHSSPWAAIRAGTAVREPAKVEPTVLRADVHVRAVVHDQVEVVRCELVCHERQPAGTELPFAQPQSFDGGGETRAGGRHGHSQSPL